MVRLTTRDIRRLLELLDCELGNVDAEGELYLMGGAVMCLALNARDATRDVDALFKPTKIIRQAAARVAATANAPEEWLNDAVKGYLSPRGDFDPFLGVCAAEAQAAGQDGSGVCGDVADWGHDGLGRGVADESGWLGGRREGRAGVPRSFHRRDGVGHGALRRPGGCAAA